MKQEKLKILLYEIICEVYEDSPNFKETMLKRLEDVFKDVKDDHTIKDN